MWDFHGRDVIIHVRLKPLLIKAITQQSPSLTDSINAPQTALSFYHNYNFIIRFFYTSYFMFLVVKMDFGSVEKYWGLKQKHKKQPFSDASASHLSLVLWHV